MKKQTKKTRTGFSLMFSAGFILFMAVVTVAIFADQIALYPYDAQNLADKLTEPCARYPFGTDQYGRCIFSRVVYGSRIALSVGMIAVTIETLIGVTLGILAGYYGKAVDKIIMFITDMTWSIPPIILALAIVIMLGPGAVNVAISIAVVSWAQFTKIIRAKVLTIKGMAYVEAAKVYGESDLQLILRYILPNLVSSIVILATLALPSAILSTTAMGFMGLGSQQPEPDWGMILSDGMNYIKKAPWISLFPGYAIVVTVLGFNLTGEGLKPFMDPKMKL